MSQPAQLPDYVTRLDNAETFTFSCHKGVVCFTECCRMLELALTPYDVLRLRKGTGLSSSEFLDNYVIMEHEPGEPFPRFYLTMVDDGRASCVFVAKEGCRIYENRPAACRAYPLGRAAVRNDDGKVEEHFVLMKETHCRGFEEPVVLTAVQYSLQQELSTYNRFNDAVAVILQHDSIRRGFVPSAGQVDLFVLALFNIDTFREMLLSDQLDSTSLASTDKERLKDDEELLLFSIDWLQRQIFT
jgi:Fe-S-cluster containining protein